MTNPFDEIIEKLDRLNEKFTAVDTASTVCTIEIIDRLELRKRLALTEPTVIRWERKGKIPCFRIGSSVRYNWPAVIEALEGKKKKS